MSHNQSQPRALALSKPRRQRGVILTRQGFKKLQLKIQDSENQHNFGCRYMLEALSEKTELDPRTVTRVLERVTGVDKKTLDCFFSAFHLELDANDYSNSNNNFEQLLGMNADYYQQSHHSTNMNTSQGSRMQVMRMLFQILVTLVELKTHMQQVQWHQQIDLHSSHKVGREIVSVLEEYTDLFTTWITTISGFASIAHTPAELSAQPEFPQDIGSVKNSVMALTARLEHCAQSLRGGLETNSATELAQLRSVHYAVASSCVLSYDS